MEGTWQAHTKVSPEKSHHATDLVQKGVYKRGREGNEGLEKGKRHRLMEAKPPA